MEDIQEKDPTKKDGCAPKTKTGALLLILRGLHGYPDSRQGFLKWRGVEYSLKTWQRWECTDHVPNIKDFIYMEKIGLIPIEGITFDVLRRAMELDKADQYRRRNGRLIATAIILSFVVVVLSLALFYNTQNSYNVSAPILSKTPDPEVCNSIVENRANTCNYKQGGQGYTWDCPFLYEYCHLTPPPGSVALPTATQTVSAP